MRWSYGFNVLLAPAESYKRDARIEEGTYHDGDSTSDEERQGLIADSDSSFSSGSESPPRRRNSGGNGALLSASDSGSGAATPMNRQTYADSNELCSCCNSDDCQQTESMPSVPPTPLNGNTGMPNGEHIHLSSFKKRKPAPDGIWAKSADWAAIKAKRARKEASSVCKQVYDSLPPPMQKTASVSGHYISTTTAALWGGMNMPLWAMLAALIVASVPQLRSLFFDKGTFVNNSVTRAVAQSGGVAVPLILVVLGANLARNTLPREQLETDDPIEERNILIASLLSRMLLPTLVMAPILAVMAKFVPVSILDDPIFIIVCFLLAGAPSALQLAQMCQINNVYMGAMSRLLFQSYVIWYVLRVLV